MQNAFKYSARIHCEITVYTLEYVISNLLLSVLITGRLCRQYIPAVKTCNDLGIMVDDYSN